MARVSADIEARADGEDVVIRVGANDADSMVWALRMHARRSCAPSRYREMADAIESAVEQAFDNGAIPAPGLVVTVVRR